MFVYNIVFDFCFKGIDCLSGFIIYRYYICMVVEFKGFSMGFFILLSD